MTSEILLDTASEVVQRSVGLRLDPAQRHRLDYWLHHTAKQRGVPDQTIVEEIAAEGPALQACLDELTVQETSFFRDPAQVAAFRRDVVPTLHSPLTVWSAGCAWGHEPYTIAMVLAESGIAEWQVVASDISSRALRQAASGRYEERQLTGLGETERSRYLRKAGDQWEIVPELRSKVTVFRHNLIRDPALAQAAGAEVVFCRNVLIYFDRHDVLAALERIATTMDPRGWVFLGYSESLWQVTERFHLVRVGTAFAYRQPDPAMAAPAAGVLPLADHSNHSRGTSKRTKAPVQPAAGLDAGRGSRARAATHAEARGGSRSLRSRGRRPGLRPRSLHALQAARGVRALPVASSGGRGEPGRRRPFDRGSPRRGRGRSAVRRRGRRRGRAPEGRLPRPRSRHRPLPAGSGL
jgi:chemotaxis methyl-accepting protein methylase